MALLEVQKTLTHNIAARAGLASKTPRHLPVKQVPSYQQIIKDLQFAVDAGDEEFAPVMKMLLREAIHLTHNHADVTSPAYQTALTAVKTAYLELLNLEVSHPVGKRLQERYWQTYNNQFWDFLETERLLNKTQTPTNRVVSAGNVNKNTYFLLKRVMDFIISSILIVAFAPILLLVAIAIRLDSKGPALFIQERVGAKRVTRSGITTWEVRKFKIYKFRSMYTNADQSIHKAHIERWVKGEDAAKEKHNGGKDPRITRVGYFIRKTSLDELPQLFNVWLGQMSMVGPRPVPGYEVAQYSDKDRERLAATPGMTGLWQIKGRGRVTFEQQIAMDIEYIHGQSLWQDIKILVLTLPAVIASRGAK
jgi:lipopolysaccharide/colanic/teichoic acid biosynthesis glycosyltransferase